MNATNYTQVNEYLTANFPTLNETDLDAIDDFYPPYSLPTHEEYFSVTADTFGDVSFTCPGLYLTQAMAVKSSNTTWRYQYNVEDRNVVAQGFGVPHVADLGAILGPNLRGNASISDMSFHTWNGVGQNNSDISYTTYNAPIVPVVMDYYISFVATLDPNTLRHESAPRWTPFQTGSMETGLNKQNLLVETNNTRMSNVTRVQLDRCYLWDSVIQAHAK